jgi:acyl-CoA reductase-like NAD-dependent aldehyde dehydrogenase
LKRAAAVWAGMSEVELVRRRVAPGRTERLREWMAEIRSRRDEALETLEHEGMISEAAFLERAEDGDYLVYFMEAADLDRAYEAFESSPYDVDREHREVLAEVLADDQPEETIEPLYHLVNPERREDAADA